MLFRTTTNLCLGILSIPICVSAQQSSSVVIPGSRFQDSTSFKTKIDTLPASMLKRNANAVKSSFQDLGNSAKSLVAQPLNDSKDLIKNEMNSLLKKPIVLERAGFSGTGIADTSYFLTGGKFYYQHIVDFNSSWSLMGIPVIINYQNQYMADGLTATVNNFDFRFDKDAHLRQLQARIAGKMNPSALLNKLGDPVELLKQQARQSLDADLLELRNSYKGVLDKDIAAIVADPASVFSSDIHQIRQEILNEGFIQKVRQEEQMLEALQQKKNLGERGLQGEIEMLNKDVVQLKARQELLDKISEHKKRWESSGLLRKIKEADIARSEQLIRMLKDPVFIREQARKYLPLKGLERFFLNVNRLNLGRDALSLSPMSFQHFLHNGISAEFLGNKGKTLMLAMGKQKDFNAVIDNGFTGFLFSNNSQMKAIRFGLGAGKLSSSQVSVSSFSQSMGGMLGTPFASQEFRRILVTTISNQLNIGKKGMLAIDLSRSATSYQDILNAPDSILKTRNPLNRILSGDNFLNNTAFALRYSDEYVAKGLSYQLNFSKVANGYNNPGNTFLNGGSIEVGGQVRKSFWKNKLQLSFRGNLKDYQYGDEADRKWRNIYVVMDARWKMRKGQHIGLRYQPNRMQRIEDGAKYTATAVDRISVETSLYKKIGKLSYRNYLTAGYQSNKYVYSGSGNIYSTSLQLSSFQSIAINNRLLYANFNYTLADNRSQYVFFNSSFNADAGCSYILLKKIAASSGLVYASVSEWYNQFGVRQTVSGQLSEKFSVNVYLDIKKNIRTTSQSSWNEPVRADISIRYMFK